MGPGLRRDDEKLGDYIVNPDCFVSGPGPGSSERAVKLRALGDPRCDRTPQKSGLSIGFGGERTIVREPAFALSSARMRSAARLDQSRPSARAKISRF